MLAISLRSAYNLCNSTTEFRVLRVGGSIRVPKDSFHAWLVRAAGQVGSYDIYHKKPRILRGPLHQLEKA